MNFISKIFKGLGEGDILVHSQFQKFSKGKFVNRALIEARKSGNKYTVKTSSEFANELVRVMAEKLGDRKTIIKGAVVSTSDLRDELDPIDIKQFQGVKRYLIEREMSGNEILELLDRLPKAFFALTFSHPETGESLKIKPKAPKSGKGGKKGEKPKADFCTLKTTDEKILKDFIFENDDFKKIEIIHTYIIDEVIIPEELKDEKDFSKVREGALRKGRILREAEIEGKIIKSEKEFSA